MKDLAVRVRAWVDSLQSRERLALAVGAAAAVLIVVGGGLLTLGQRVDSARERVDQKERDLAFLQQATAEVLAAGPLPSGAGEEPLAVLADRAAREAGLGGSLTGSEVTGDGALRASFRDAGFDALASMLARLARQSGVRVDSASIDAAEQPGRVNAIIVLRADTQG